MRFYGSIAYDWHGRHASALAEPSRRPAAIVDLRDDMVLVGRPVGGTQLVAWEWVRELHGWAPVPEEDR